MKRTLRLQRESLTDLTADELTGMAGGGDFTRAGFTCPLRGCAGELTVLPECGLTFQPTCA